MNKKTITYTIDFTNIDYTPKKTKKLLRKLSNLRKIADITQKSLIIYTPNKPPFKNPQTMNQYEFSLHVAINAAEMSSKSERYEYLYDQICFYLDNVCTIHNLCNFKNNKCFAKAHTDMTMGCCHHFPNKKLGIFYQNKLVECEHLSETGCTTKSIGCKLFMCDAVRKKGYNFNVHNILLIRYFFNLIQKYIIRASVFETQEKTIQKLLKF